MTSEAGCICLELMCGGGVCSILLLPFVVSCLETIDVCIWCMFVFMSVVVTVGVCDNVCCVVGVVEYCVLAKCLLLFSPCCCGECFYYL